MEHTLPEAEAPEPRRTARWRFIVGGVAVYAIVPLVMFLSMNRQVSARAIGYANLAGLALAGYGFWRLVDRDAVAGLLARCGALAGYSTISTVVRAILVGVATWVACDLTFKALVTTLVFASRS